jgi:predicted nuclease of restriction endonuclease-like (RecB) superfamily
LPSEGNSITFTDVGRDYLKQIIKDGKSLDNLLVKEFESENMSISNIQKKIRSSI